jgi:hypothetical protein
VRSKDAKAALMLALLAGWTATPALAVDDISLNVTGPTTVEPGDAVTVTVDVANLSETINGVQIRINYDDTLMTLVDVAANGAEGYAEIPETDTNGNVDWGATVNAGCSTISDHTVATITFTAIAEGTTSVVFRADAVKRHLRSVSRHQDGLGDDHANLRRRKRLHDRHIQRRNVRSHARIQRDDLPRRCFGVRRGGNV